MELPFAKLFSPLNYVYLLRCRLAEPWLDMGLTWCWGSFFCSFLQRPYQQQPAPSTKTLPDTSLQPPPAINKTLPDAIPAHWGDTIFFFTLFGNTAFLQRCIFFFFLKTTKEVCTKLSRFFSLSGRVFSCKNKNYSVCEYLESRSPIQINWESSQKNFWILFTWKEDSFPFSKNLFFSTFVIPEEFKFSDGC